MSVRPPRGRRGTAATIAALLGLLVCAAGAVEALYLATTDATWGFTSSSLSDFLGRTTLGSTAVLVTAIVLAVLGVLALLAGVLPPHRRLIELDGDDATVATGLTRRSLRRTLRAAAESVDGIGDAPVTVGRRRVVVKASTALRHTDGLTDRVDTAVRNRLDDLRPRRARRVKVRLDRKES
ncbi:DUF6286 domain-containing protein [Jatrophihabitans sp. YIM 134969]